mmetsp:Transcript_10517/g.21833  ORF Transcript_10517/g.21833 Transcript_10517/m.21833 type:complete len:210 (+) Transcript_10517:395-1024(+)
MFFVIKEELFLIRVEAADDDDDLFEDLFSLSPPLSFDSPVVPLPLPLPPPVSFAFITLPPLPSPFSALVISLFESPAMLLLLPLFNDPDELEFELDIVSEVVVAAEVDICIDEDRSDWVYSCLVFVLAGESFDLFFLSSGESCRFAVTLSSLRPLIFATFMPYISMLSSDEDRSDEEDEDEVVGDAPSFDFLLGLLSVSFPSSPELLRL